MSFRFEPADSFIGYQGDTPAAVVFKASKTSKNTNDDDVRYVVDTKFINWLQNSDVKWMQISADTNHYSRCNC